MIAWLYEDLTRPTAVSKAPLIGEPATASSKSRPVTVTYSENGFSPVEAIVKKGDTVRFVAAEGVSLRIVSDYSAFNQKEAVSEYSFTFTEVGTFTYYDSTSKTSPFGKFISEFFGNRRVLQGTVKVTE
jgi:plastocyanin